MIASLKEFIERYTHLTKEDWQHIEQQFTRQVFQKDEILLREGQTCRYFYFFEKGLIRFYYHVDGDDITKTFALAPYCFTSKISFRNQSPAQENIQALDKTIVWKTTYAQYRELEKMHAWNLFMRKLLNEIQEYTEKIMLESKTQTAEQRYRDLLEIYPADLLQKIPLKHLASFLGIAPQSLSRIRNNLQKNHRS